MGCLSNLENLNAVFISEGMSQAQRLAKLNAICYQPNENTDRRSPGFSIRRKKQRLILKIACI